MSNNHTDNTDEKSDSNADTEPQFRSLINPVSIKLPRVKSILHEMEEKGIRLPSGLTKTIENIPGEDEEQRFTVLNQIGQGGMGHVYRVFDRDIGRTIAVKSIKLDKSNPVNFKRALNEMQITGQLEHPNIMPLHDVGIDDNNNIYFSMKLVKGEDLGSILENLRKNKRYKGFNRQRLLEIFLKICDAVSFAHSKDVIHRDLKPHNIMVGEFGEVLLTDWGLAKIVKPRKPSRKLQSSKNIKQSELHQNPDENLSVPYKIRDNQDYEDSYFGTRHGTVAGTPAFMPPEQALGDIENIDARSDIYSLGGILYHILTYFPPFIGSLPEIIEKVVKGELRKPSSINEEIPKELEIIALKAMSHHKATRHQTVKQLKDEIQAFLENKTIDRVSYTVFDLSRKFWKRNKLVFAWALISAIVTGLIMFFILKGHYDNKVKLDRKFIDSLNTTEIPEMDVNESKRAEIEDLSAKIKNIDSQIAKHDNSLRNYSDFNALKLPLTGFYWKTCYKKSVLQDEKYKLFRVLQSHADFIAMNSRNNAELAEVRSQINELRQSFAGTYAERKWAENEQVQTEKFLRLSKKQSQSAFINVSIATTDDAKVIEADIKLFRMIQADGYNLGPRRVPEPYAYNTRMRKVTFSQKMTYASTPEILDFWVKGGIAFNEIRQRVDIALMPGDYLLRIKVNFLDEPVIFGMKIEKMSQHKFKIIIPHEDLGKPGFVYIPGIEFQESEKTQKITPFYVAKTEVSLGEYLKFLNSRENPAGLFLTPEKLLPRLDDSRTAVRFDAQTKKIVPQKGAKDSQSVTGIDFADITEYLRWLNSENKGKGKFEMMTLNNFRRMNPYNWDYIWGYRDNEYFRFAEKPAHFFADTNVFRIQGLNTGIQEFVFDEENSKLFTTSASNINKFKELTLVTQSSHSENTGFRLVYIIE